MSYFLGIDIGTTHAKAVIVNPEGQTFFETKRDYPLLHPQAGYEEQDAEKILAVVVKLISEALNSLTPGGKLAAIGFSAAMHSILPVDDAGNPLYNAIIWADTRSKKEATDMLREPVSRVVYQNTGIPIHPMSPLCKIIWFRDNQPDIFAKTTRFISIKEFILFHLCGHYIVDYSIASASGLFNIHEKKWDSLALSLAGIGEDKLSAPVSTLHREPGFTSFYIQHFQLKENIPLIAGASDGCLANLGSGAIGHGETALTIGTSGAVRMTVKETVPLAKEGLFTYLLADDIYVRGGAINNGGIVLKWLQELFIGDNGEFRENSYDVLLALASEVAPGADGLFFLPYLLGERAPVWDADAKGVLSGLTIHHKKAHIIRAALEGISFTLYQVLNELETVYGPVKEIYVSGGFVRSPFWVQLIADVTGKRLKVTDMTDASAIGAAYLAMYATGFLDSLIRVKEFIQVSRVYDPNPVAHGVYSQRFQLFNLLYPKLKDDFAAISRLQEN